MKLNVTSSVIESPTKEQHRLCTHLVVDDGRIGMTVNCVSDEWDARPVDRLDRERCAWYGQWEVRFKYLDAETPFLTMGLGDTKLETPEGSAEQYGIELFSIEALSDDYAIYNMVNRVLYRLLQAPNYERAGAVVLTDRMELAEWLMRSGIRYGMKEGDFKVSRYFKDVSVERLYNFGAGSGLQVKQTLLTYTRGNKRRETQLLLNSEHHYVRTEEFVKAPDRYSINSLLASHGEPRAQLHLQTPAAVVSQINQTLVLLKSNGYSDALLNQLILETNARTEEHLRNTIAHGAGFNSFMTNPLMSPQHQYSNGPMPMGYATRDNVNHTPTVYGAGAAPNFYY